MTCTRGCTGVSICNGQICCIQLQQDCGTGCVGIAEGFSRIQVNAAGELIICSNVGGVCECRAVCTECIDQIVSANDCVSGGVGADYMVRDFTLANGTLTINSAPEHTTVAVTGTRTATVPAVGNPSVVPLQLVDQNNASLTITNPSLCRSMEIQVVASGKVDIREMNLAVPTFGGTYTSRLQLDSTQSGANIRAIGTKFPSPWPNTVPALLRDGQSDALSFTEIIPPGASVTYTAISQLRSDVAGFPVVATESGTQLTAFGSTI